ncbi:MAG: hypothetical protein KC621_07100 [Myxococcales bacterium]|nr:hypothetical protein [Myxococcales bacterium]
MHRGRCCAPAVRAAPPPLPELVSAEPLPGAPDATTCGEDQYYWTTFLRYYDVKDLSDRPEAQERIRAWVARAPGEASVRMRNDILIVRGYPPLLTAVDAWLAALRRGEEGAGPPVPDLPRFALTGTHPVLKSVETVVQIHPVADIVGLELPADTDLVFDRAAVGSLAVKAGQPITTEGLAAGLRGWLHDLDQDDTELTPGPGRTTLVVRGNRSGQAAVANALTLLRRQLAWAFEPPLAGAVEATAATLRIYDVSDLLVDPVPVAMELPWPDGTTRSFAADAHIPGEQLAGALHSAAGDVKGEVAYEGGTRAGRGHLIVSGPHAFHERVATALGTLRRAYELYVLPPLPQGE